MRWKKSFRCRSFQPRRRKNQGVEELAEHAVRIARLGETHGRVDFCNPKDHNGAVHRAIHGIMSLVGDHAEAAAFRFDLRSRS